MKSQHTDPSIESASRFERNHPEVFPVVKSWVVIPIVD